MNVKLVRDDAHVLKLVSFGGAVGLPELQIQANMPEEHPISAASLTWLKYP